MPTTPTPKLDAFHGFSVVQSVTLSKRELGGGGGGGSGGGGTSTSTGKRMSGMEGPNRETSAQSLFKASWMLGISAVAEEKDT